MLIISKSFNFDEFETALRDAKVNFQLRIPSQISHTGSWGNEVALIQLLLTWSRAHESPTIKTYINDGDTEARDKQLDDFGKRLYGITAFYLAKEVITAQGTAIARDEYARHCNGVLRAMNECDIYSTDSVNKTYPQNIGKVAAQFICLHGSRFEFLRSLYNAPSRAETLGRLEFGELVQSAFSQNKPFAKYLDRERNLKTDLGNLIYELFRNTNDHAYEMLDGTSFSKNVRGFSIKSHSELVEHNDLSKMRSQNARFNEYLEFCMTLFKGNGLESIRFLELSIIDGGLGLAQRFTGSILTNLSLEEEKHITANCFKQGVSSKGAQSRGEGLDEVWKALCKLHGFIRIRTGRLCLFQTFHDLTSTADPQFSDWSEHELEMVSGTAITIIIPCVF